MFFIICCLFLFWLVFVWVCFVCLILFLFCLFMSRFVSVCWIVGLVWFGGWLAGWLAGWSVGPLSVGWLVGWFVVARVCVLCFVLFDTAFTYFVCCCTLFCSLVCLSVV